MSGIAAGFGKPDRGQIEAMLEKMVHRGPDISGIAMTDGSALAQNYYRADISTEKSDTIPFCFPENPDLKICYDGQMGNTGELARDNGLEPGPFMEERVILRLFEKSGRDMPSQLDDAVFAFVISTGNGFLAARDVLGIKTLFYARKNGTLYFATELKSILTVTEDVYEFPAGHYMDCDGDPKPFAKLPEALPAQMHSDGDKMVADVRSIIEKSIRNRIDFKYETASLLSGGIDSSVIAMLASREYKKKFGENAKLKTFSLGVGESEDIINARKVAERIGSDHHEVIVGLEDILEVLPDVIYNLENFDPSLVRSSASNHIISRYAAEKHNIEVLLSGEGGDEVFCGYMYLKKFPLEQQFEKQIQCLGFLHNNASLRLDRMNHCNGIRVVAPLISGELLDYSLAIPPEYKQKPDGDEKIEKWIFRKAFENDLPTDVVWRIKQEFSQGSGSADVLPGHFETVVSDEELAKVQAEFPIVRSKEEVYYFNLFCKNFPGRKAVETVGQWILL